MTIDVTSLNRRSPAALRAFVGAQHLGVERRPEAVDQAQPSDHSYWRYLVRRVPLEGRCVHYQTYDVGGAENDWNINIAPDPAYEWLLDPCILHALSLISGAPEPLDPGEIKFYDCVRAIECELSPDDGLHGTFEPAGLPIDPGSSTPDEAELEGSGPTGCWVGVYGVFAGDFGHGGRPEIHPFDAFWRRFHEPRSSSISWDLGVFQDDSNRFNSDWSQAPIDVEFRVPFCLDVPVTLTSAVTRRVRFTLRRSAFCSAVGKNTRPAGTGDLAETFTAPTVRLNPGLRNRLEVSVEDLTGLAGSPFALSFADLTYTTSRRLNMLTGQAWLAGSIVVRVAVDQEGFAYWNLSGPNSRTAAVAPDGDRVVTEPEDVIALLAAARARRANPIALTVAQVRPVVSAGETPHLAAELVIERTQDAGQTVSRTVIVRPREEPLLVDEASGETVSLDSFDLFATASLGTTGRVSRRMEADITGVIARLAGLDQDQRLRASAATIEVDTFVTIELAARYAPFRDGEVYGEERSRLSESVNRAAPGPVEVRADVRIVGADGRVRRRRIANGPRDAGASTEGVRIEAEGGMHRLVVGPLGDEPITVRVEATLADRFGLRSTARASAHNFRVADARAWVERVAGISLAQLRRRRDGFERAERAAPTRESLAAAGMLRALVDGLELLDGPEAAPAARVAGALRLAVRVGELLPAGRSLGAGAAPYSPS